MNHDKVLHQIPSIQLAKSNSWNSSSTQRSLVDRLATDLVITFLMKCASWQMVIPDLQWIHVARLLSLFVGDADGSPPFGHNGQEHASHRGLQQVRPRTHSASTKVGDHDCCYDSFVFCIHLQSVFYEDRLTKRSKPKLHVLHRHDLHMKVREYCCKLGCADVDSVISTSWTMTTHQDGESTQ
jgi:hypothetical protein